MPLGKKMGIKQKLGLQKPKAKAKQDPMSKTLLGIYKKGGLTAGAVGALAKASLEIHPGSSASSSTVSTAPMVQRLAQAAATKDRARKAGAKQLPDNRHAARALQTSLKTSTPLKTGLYTANIPMWNRKKGTQTVHPMSFLPIHEVLEQLIQEGDEKKYCDLSGDQHGFKLALQQWRNRVDATSRFMDTCLSIVLWGDSAPHVKRDSLFLITWTLVSGPCRRRYWLCSFPKSEMCQCGCFGRHTYDAVFEVIAWCFKVLLAGVWPSVDHTNTKFPAASWRAGLARAKTKLRLGGACIGNTGDWQWYKSVLGMRGWKPEGPSKNLCWLCRAGMGTDIDCYEFGAAASWRATMLTQSEFWDDAFRENRYVSTVWKIPGFHLSLVRIDWMHCVDLGVLQYFSGNILWDLFRDLGGTMRKPKDACGKLEDLICMCAKRLGCERPFYFSDSHHDSCFYKKSAKAEAQGS